MSYPARAEGLVNVIIKTKARDRWPKCPKNSYIFILSLSLSVKYKEINFKIILIKTIWNFEGGLSSSCQTFKDWLLMLLMSVCEYVSDFNIGEWVYNDHRKTDWVQIMDEALWIKPLRMAWIYFPTTSLDRLSSLVLVGLRKRRRKSELKTCEGAWGESVVRWCTVLLLLPHPKCLDWHKPLFITIKIIACVKLNHLMVRFESWGFEDCGVPLHYYYSQAHSGPDWLCLLGSNLSIK